MSYVIEKFEVRNRWTDEVQFTAEISVTENMLPSVKLGRAVKWARDNGADLRYADLSNADLRYADLRGADMNDCPVKIADIHKKVYAAASAEGALNMGDWHTCETTHCRAGWVTHLAGEGGKVLEFAFGTPAAAAMIYMASDPYLTKVPDFYASNEDALEDMARLAGVSA